MDYFQHPCLRFTWVYATFYLLHHFQDKHYLYGSLTAILIKQNKHEISQNFNVMNSIHK